LIEDYVYKIMRTRHVLFLSTIKLSSCITFQLFFTYRYKINKLLFLSNLHYEVISRVKMYFFSFLWTILRQTVVFLMLFSCDVNITIIRFIYYIFISTKYLSDHVSKKSAIAAIFLFIQLYEQPLRSLLSMFSPYPFFFSVHEI